MAPLSWSKDGISFRMFFWIRAAGSTFWKRGERSYSFRAFCPLKTSCLLLKVGGERRRLEIAC